MNRLLALVGLFLVLSPAAQEPAGADTDSLPDGITCTVEARWSGRFRRSGKLRIELTVVNESSTPVEVAFRSSARVCGALHDSKDKAYYRFPEAAAQVVGTEPFLPRKKRVFRHEIRVADLRKALPGVNAVSAWLCGYETVRAWAEFDMPVWPPE